MLEILMLIGPVFGLIGLGWAAARSGYLDGAAARPLAAFGYRIAMPALLFRAMAGVGEVPVSPLLLAKAYVTGVGTTWIIATVLAWMVLRRPAVDGPAIAIGACFSNGVMLGFPVILLALGSAAATPMAFLATLETVLLWVAGTVHMGLVARGKGAGLRALATVGREIVTNPLILALAAGIAWRFAGLGALPAPAAKLVDLLAGAAIPVSLSALGMSLVAYRIEGEWKSVSLICLLKLLAYPALAFWLATEVFHLPDVWVGALVIYVAMPVGANAFIFAARYERAVASVSAAVAVSTVASVATVTMALGYLRSRGIVVGM